MEANAENIAPTTLSLSTKRKRTCDEDDEITSKGSPKPIKTSRLALATRNGNGTPRLSATVKSTPSTPKSAPLLQPAGRSPPPKSGRAFGHRSTIAKPRPELSKRGVARPFSLATALSQSKPPKPPSKAPASWFFDIHVDSEQEEMTNLMQHSTGVLDISDDEGKPSPDDGRGKENIPPAELGIDLPASRETVSLAATAAARTASKMEEDRSPLKELKASDYYPEDCNAFSYAVVYDDEEDDNIPAPKKASVPISPSQDVFVSPATTASIGSVLEAAVSQQSIDNPTSTTSPTAGMKG